MKHFLALGMLLATPLASSNAEAKAPPADGGFREQCSGPKLGHPQASWRCLERGYSSVAQMQADLEKRNPRVKWEPASTRDEALRNVQGKDVWWDCVPRTEQPCSYWVRMQPGQYIVLEQLLDRSRGNAWLGIGVSTWCDGSKQQCEALLAAAAGILDSTVDFADSHSWVGTPPMAVPPPPPPPSR